MTRPVDSTPIWRCYRKSRTRADDPVPTVMCVASFHIMRPMTIRSIAAAIVATTAGFLCLSTQPAAAQDTSQNNALRVLVSNGMKGTMEELQPQCEKASGRSLAIQFVSTASLKKRIEMGEAFDVTIITTEAIGDLIKQGKLTSASRMDVGRSELGIGIRTGGPRPDIRTPKALKKALQEAKSI